MFPFSDKTYQWLKWTAQIFGPAFITLFAGIWAILAGHSILPAELGVAIAAILALAVTFIGSLAQISTAEYNRQKFNEIQGIQPVAGKYDLSMQGEGTD